MNVIKKYDMINNWTQLKKPEVLLSHNYFPIKKKIPTSVVMLTYDWTRINSQDIWCLFIRFVTVYMWKAINQAKWNNIVSLTHSL